MSYITFDTYETADTDIMIAVNAVNDDESRLIGLLTMTRKEWAEFKDVLVNSFLTSIAEKPE